MPDHRNGEKRRQDSHAGDEPPERATRLSCSAIDKAGSEQTQQHDGGKAVQRLLVERSRRKDEQIVVGEDRGASDQNQQDRLPLTAGQSAARR